ncbi:MAG: ABC transporter permease, partial [Aeromonas veronii]
MSQVRIPAWVSVGVLSAVNILLAFLVSAILFYYLDINPVDAAKIMWYGAFGTGEGVG